MILSRPRLLILGAIAVAGCKKDQPEEEMHERASAAQPVASTPLESATMGVTDFCKLVYEAPLRQLEKSCSDTEKKSPTFSRIAAKVQERTQSCWKMLNAGLQNKRLSLPSGTAKRCAEALEKLPWRNALIGDITLTSECRNLGVGLSVAGKPCKSAYECNPGLFCSGAREDSEGVCMKRVAAGDRCERSTFTLLGEVETSCESGLFCDHGLLAAVEGIPTVPAPRYGLGEPEPETGPKVRLKMGTTTVSGRLPPEIIQRIVRQNFGRFRACYQAGLQSNPTLAGRVTVKFVISSSGSVSSVSGDGDIGDPGVISCVSSVFQSMTFPQPEGGVVLVSYPIVFSQGDGDADTDGGETPSTSLGAPTNTCMAFRKEGDECRHTRECGGGLSCVMSKCGKPAKAGDACRIRSDCEEPLLCSAKSAPAPKPEGEAPWGEDAPLERVCKPAEGDQVCSSDEECLGACIDGKCQAFCGAG